MLAVSFGRVLHHHRMPLDELLLQELSYIALPCTTFVNIESLVFVSKD